MRAWVNGQLLDDPTAPAIAVSDHGLTVGDGVFEAVKVVDGQPFALTLPPRAAGAVGGGAGAAGARRGGWYARASRPCWPGEALPLGRLRITYTGGPAPLGSGRGDAPPTLVVVGGADEPWPRRRPRSPRCPGPATSGARSPASRRRRTPRTWSPWPRPSAAGRREAIFANLAGHLCEGTGTNVFYVVDGELRTPTLASGCLAGVTRGAGPGVVRRARGRRADRGARAGRARSSWPRPPATSRRVAALGRPRPRGARPGHGRGARHLAPPRARAPGCLSTLRM